MRFTNEYGDYVMPCHSIQFSFFVRNKGGIQCYFLSWWRYILACVMCMHENICAKTTPPRLRCDVLVSSLPIFTVNAQINFHSPTQIQAHWAMYPHLHKRAHTLQICSLLECLCDVGKLTGEKEFKHKNDYTLHSTYTICTHHTTDLSNTVRILRLQHLFSIRTQTDLHAYTCTSAYVHAQAFPHWLDLFYHRLSIGFNTIHSY